MKNTRTILIAVAVLLPATLLIAPWIGIVPLAWSDASRGWWHDDLTGNETIL